MEPKHINIADEIDSDIPRRFEAAFANLPRIQKDVFRLHRLEDLSYEEIAQLYGLTILEVERQMAKAITKLKKQMDGHKLSWWNRWLCPMSLRNALSQHRPAPCSKLVRP